MKCDFGVLATREIGVIESAKRSKTDCRRTIMKANRLAGVIGVLILGVSGPNTAIELGVKTRTNFFSLAISRMFFKPLMFTFQHLSGFNSPAPDSNAAI